MIGVILSGGQSSRMGSDKGLITTAGGISWVQRAFDIATQVCTQVVVSVNREQLTSYRAILAPYLLIADDAQLPVKGPLLGLLSAHQQYPEDDLLLLATDMIQMDVVVLGALLEQHHTYPGREVYLFMNERFAEPLCAVYTAPALGRLLEHYRTGQCNRWSMKYMLSELDVHTCPLPPAWKPFFANVNTKEELPSN